MKSVLFALILGLGSVALADVHCSVHAIDSAGNITVEPFAQKTIAEDGQMAIIHQIDNQAFIAVAKSDLLMAGMMNVSTQKGDLAASNGSVVVFYSNESNYAVSCARQ